MTASTTAALSRALALGAPLDEARLALYLRFGLALAALSVVFEKLIDLEGNIVLGRWEIVGATVGLAIGTALMPFERTSRAGIAVFSLALAVYVAEKWAAYHNHGWLTVWTIPVALAFGAAWWQSDVYRWYLRTTLGIVMLAACAQKLVAGTYIDGTYITFLSLQGSTTERLFSVFCGPEAATGSCLAHKAIGTFIVAWQAVVGILLVAGLRSLAFLFVEIAFLLGAGLYADEMNFQVLNIALLSVAFGYGMRPWLAALCLGLLAIDVYSISGLVDDAL